MTPEERAELEARMKRLEARERQLRQMVEAGIADMTRRAAAGRPYPAPPGYPSSFDIENARWVGAGAAAVRRLPRAAQLARRRS